MIYNAKKSKANRNALRRELAQIGQTRPVTRSDNRPIKVIKGGINKDAPAEVVSIALPSEHVAPARRTSEDQPDLYDAVAANLNRTLKQLRARR